MSQNNTFAMSPGYRLLLMDAGLDPDAVLKRAGLPLNIFAQKQARISPAEWFSFWKGIEDEADDPLVALRFASSFSVEAFDPLIFAAICSDNLSQALGRIQDYKKILAPMKLHLEVGKEVTTAALEWLLVTQPPPKSLAAVELVFLVQLARLSTRHRIVPLAVEAPLPPKEVSAFAEYFGVEITQGERPKLVFSAEDAARPFLTSNAGMWNFFEPDLQKCLNKLEAPVSTSEQVKATLLELLPSGETSIQAVSVKLGASSRTLQRHLQKEGLNFQGLLNNTREELATHYLRASDLSGAEISFLLGFDDPNSFFRAFQSWTGKTPNQIRISS
ncbi:MAG: AraC family transcriptional regulator ligand-binding domain-containing protein [SAR324 cluster bacterium]|nr:AraC family transcriptional regulator ligand-binding domain-containing protein [SAR324 cluster bacterium]